MTQDEIIRMAQTCGFSREDHHAIYGILTRFAELVAAAEREACAKAVEAEAHMFETLAAAKSLSAAIRARGNT